MTITELIAALTAQLEAAGDREVLVHCGGCCPHGHEIRGMAMGQREDEREALVIEV